jgi:hypothetical protein
MEDFMPMLSNSDFFTIPPLDVENKMIQPTVRLYQKLSFKFNTLSQDIQNTWLDMQSSTIAGIKQMYRHPDDTIRLWYGQAADTGAQLYARLNSEWQSLYQKMSQTALNVRDSIATTAQQFYEHPGPTVTAWYQHAGNKGNALIAEAQTELQPIYQQWQTTLTAGKTKAEQAVDHLQTLLEHPQQAALSALEPVARTAANASAQAEHYLQMFLAHPAEFIASMIAPLTAYIKSESAEAKAALIDTYYGLVDMANLIASQPGLMIHAFYNKTLAALLNVYYDVISSLLVTV